MMPAWADALVALLLLTGGVFSLIGAWGLLRLPDFFTRLHAPSKATTLGLGCTLLAMSLDAWFREGAGALRYLLPVVLVFVTAPVSAHMLARAARRRS